MPKEHGVTNPLRATSFYYKHLLYVEPLVMCWRPKRESGEARQGIHSPAWGRGRGQVDGPQGWLCAGPRGCGTSHLS